MLIILEGISGVGKSTIAIKLKEALVSEGHEVTIIKHPNINNPYGRRTRTWIDLKHKTSNKVLIKFIDLMIAVLAMKDFKLSLQQVNDSPEQVFIWERSPLSSLVYNASSILSKRLILKALTKMTLPPETKWCYFNDVNFYDLVLRLKQRNRDAQDAIPNRNNLITQHLRFKFFLSILASNIIIDAKDSIYTGFRWQYSLEGIENNLSDLMFFLKSNDTYNFF